MITVTTILGAASEPKIADLLHDLEHSNRIEFFVVNRDDTLRHRFRGATDKGTKITIALDRNERLADGAVLLLEATRAIVVRTTEEHWMRIKPLDRDAALEAGYCAGNHHWRVKFDPGVLLIAIEGPVEHYTSRLEHLLEAGRIKVADDE